MADVCIITWKRDGTPHMVTKTRNQAIKYCKDSPQYTWECYEVHGVRKK